MKDLIYWGATGQSIVLDELMSSLGYKAIAVFDNNRDCKSPFDNVPIYYGIDQLTEWIKGKDVREIHYLVAIGGSKGVERENIHLMLNNLGLKSVSAIHPTAFVAKDARIGQGSQIMANVSICSRVDIGEMSIINTAASVDHECRIGKAAHIAPGAVLAGCIDLGDYSFVGTGAVILPNIKIGKNVIIGAGAVVTKDIPSDKIVVGNPARIKK